MADSLPDEIVQSIAIANAKSIGEQPAILANMALANQILNNNMAAQLFIGQQQAMNQVIMATMAKAVSVILSPNPLDDAGAQQAQELVQQLQQQFQATQKMIQDSAQANIALQTSLADQIKAAQATSH